MIINTMPNKALHDFKGTNECFLIKECVSIIMKCATISNPIIYYLFIYFYNLGIRLFDLTNPRGSLCKSARRRRTTLNLSVILESCYFSYLAMTGI